jgi:subtilisin family serine protease
MKTQRHGFFLLLVLLALMLNLAHPAVLPTAAQSSPEAHTLIAKARANGTVPVIVGLRVAFQPEGRLADAASVQNQRAAIRVAQDALLTQMAAYHPQSVKKFDYIPFMAMWVDAAALTFLSTWRDVTSIEEDVAVPPTLAESVPLIGAPTVWASGYTGSGQTVAILDSGVDKTHPFLAGKVVSEACYSNGGGGGTSVCPGGSNSTATGSGVNCSTSISGCTHGTHVAGIAAGKANGSLGFNGVAKDADIIAIQVFSGFNNASDCSPNAAPCALTYTSDQVLGLQRVQALSSSHNIAAANMSLGGGRYYTQASCDSANASRKAAIDNLRSLNIATVIASGNSGYTDSMSSPGCISTAVSVGSTGDGSSGTTQDAVMSYSNSVSFLNLLAPGQKSILLRPAIPGAIGMAPRWRRLTSPAHGLCSNPNYPPPRSIKSSPH